MSALLECSLNNFMFSTRRCLLCHKLQRHFSFLWKEWQMGYFCQGFVCLSAHKERAAEGKSGAFLFCTLLLLPVPLWKWAGWAGRLKLGVGIDKINFVSLILRSRKTHSILVGVFSPFTSLPSISNVISCLICIFFLIALVFCGRVFLCVQNKASFYSICLKAIPFVSSHLLVSWNPDSTKSTIPSKFKIFNGSFFKP